MKIKLQTKNVFNYLFFCVLILGIAFMFLGTTQFWKGYHNIDLGRNIDWINTKYDLKLIDSYEIGKTWTATEMYMYGLEQIEGAFYLFGIGCLLTGLYIGLWVNKND